eukprot:8352049-Ditylum_brightwellii.AAC.1
MSQVNSNIDDFNQYVKQSLTGLRSRGETIEDLMINLFKGHKAASNAVFVGYIKRLEESYEDGETNLTAEILMSRAVNKHSTRKSKLIWGALTPERQDIVALTPTVQGLKDQNLRLKKDLGKKKQETP